MPPPARCALLSASLLVPTFLLACAGGLPHQRKARTDAAKVLDCPEEQVTLQASSSQMYFASGCSAGVYLVCGNGVLDIECKPGNPTPLTKAQQASKTSSPLQLASPGP